MSHNSAMGNDFQRFGVRFGDGQRRVGFYLSDTFSMLPFVSALEPLRAANRLSGQHLYSWHLFGDSDAPVQANNALYQSVEGPLADAAALHRLIVTGPHEPSTHFNPTLSPVLRRLAAGGTLMGAVDTGSFLLARARLIGERRCTLHWENQPGFAQEFPQLRMTHELFEIDDGLCTCAGGDAALDMMLTLIRGDHGHALAAEVADMFIHSGIRRSDDPQRMGVVQRTRIFKPALVTCIELMEANLDQPLSPEELAGMAGISKRQLERLFRAHLQATPADYYQQLRLRAGSRLLEQTSLSVLEVAAACGFRSTDHFSRRFRVLFGVTPSQYRVRGSRP